MSNSLTFPESALLPAVLELAAFSVALFEQYEPLVAAETPESALDHAYENLYPVPG